MKPKLILIAILALSVIGCGGATITTTSAPMKYALVFGDSNATTSEAVQEALLAVQNAVNAGYKPISIGGGAGAAAGGELVQALITVYVLLEGPITAPDIIPATGIPVPSP
jgi:hypothetical protein